jgi:ribosome maturation factor RimP
MTLEALLESTLSGMGYELVQWNFSRQGLLQVFIDKPEGISIDDCVAVSNQLSRVLPVENIAYERLEISSPGLDRPLVKPADYTRFAGESIQIKLRGVHAGRRRYFGTLAGLENGEVRIIEEGIEHAIPLDLIESARLKPEF